MLVPFLPLAGSVLKENSVDCARTHTSFGPLLSDRFSLLVVAVPEMAVHIHPRTGREREKKRSH